MSNCKIMYFDVTENNECTSVWMKDVQVIRAGTTIYAMSVKEKNEEYERYARDYDIHFIFKDKVPEVSFYTVPQVDIFAVDSNGGYIGTIGKTTDLESEAPICYINKKHLCFTIAESGKDFLEKASVWQMLLELYDGVKIYESKEEAMKEKEFIDMSTLEE